MASLGEGCVSLFFLAASHRWAGSDYLPVSSTKALLVQQSG